MKRNLIASLLVSLVAMSCGGGGGGGTLESGASGSVDTYVGTVAKGDFAVFSFDGRKLTYQVTGPVFGNRTGSLELSPVNPTNQYVYKDEDGDYFYFAGDLGVGEISIDNETVFVVGLKKVGTLNATELAGSSGKKYIFLEVDNNGTVTVHTLTLKPNKTWTINDGESNGTWEVREKGGQSCVMVRDDDNNTVANVVVKPGKSRSVLIVDNADGSGFGIGLEQKALNTTELEGIYQTYYYNPNNNVECFGTVMVNGTSYFYQERWCSDNDTESENGTIEINKLCNGTDQNGIACAGDYEVFIDPVDGYWLAVNPNTGERIFGVSSNSSLVLPE